jgi:hypothetical protein
VMAMHVLLAGKWLQETVYSHCRRIISHEL